MYSSAPATSVQTKRGGLPNLEALLNQNPTLRQSFQSEQSGYSSEDSGNRSPREHLPLTPTMCDSPSIDQFYLGMDHDSPTISIGKALTTGSGSTFTSAEFAQKAITPPEMLASLTSFFDSQQHHYAAAMNAAGLGLLDDEYDDGEFESDYGDSDDDFLDEDYEDYEYVTIEIATLVSLSRPLSKPKLVDVVARSTERTRSLTESTSRYSGTSTASKAYSQYSWTGENSSDISDHADMISEDEFHDSPENYEGFGEKLFDQGWTQSPVLDLTFSDKRASPLPPLPYSDADSDQSVPSSPSAPQTGPFEALRQPSPKATERDRLPEPPFHTVDVPSRTSSKLKTSSTRQKWMKSPSLRRSEGSYSLFSRHGS